MFGYLFPSLFTILLYVATVFWDPVSGRRSEWDRSAEESAKEDAFLSPPELAVKYGYPSEDHKVVTRDGYILSLHRIPYGRGTSPKPGEKRKVMLLNHGLFCSSADWIVTGPGNSIGYLLVEAGYDVWMANARGNTYSRNHTYLSVKLQAFWNFGLHELGIYDLPAVIDYILEQTNNEKLTFMSHSLGGAGFYVLTSMLPEYNNKIKLHISLAPAAFLYHLSNALLIAAASQNQILSTSLRLLNVKEYLPVTRPRVEFTNAFCVEHSAFQPACKLFCTILQTTSNLNSTTFVAIIGHFPAGTSSKQLQHVFQEINSGHFRQYDFGFLQNKKIYNRFTPPDYDLKKVTTPVVLIGGKDDILVAPRDLDRLQRQLPNLLERITVPDRKFNHFDFVWGINAKEVLHPLILQALQKYD